LQQKNIPLQSYIFEDNKGMRREVERERVRKRNKEKEGEHWRKGIMGKRKSKRDKDK
jgi:hypothetical protein